ncbi:MAG: aminodeoxychorismate/anthranilate synthase component II [Myxococcales bacterium]|nr:aminodeoxychorismate/anthranilate synthase component II [Myxococcales bacterium]MCB9736312.1 aminodeoxychorismate/anthranilate synthase component II [Deltaproteobacteria bacterium]
MIDNYDSFTFNLVQYLGELGATVETVRNDALGVDEAIERAGDAIVVSPGPCTPTEAGISVPLIQAASGRVPILGVCLGHQALAQAFGGTIVRTGIIMHGKTSPVHHADTDVFRGLPNPFAATRYHSLMARAEDLPGCLDVTAWTDDPQQRTIMGLAHKDHPTWGVQFHPESILTTAGKALLGNFLDLVRGGGQEAAA